MSQSFLDYDGLAFYTTLVKCMIASARPVDATGDGKAYTATIPEVTELQKGLAIIIVPDTTSAATIPTLNVNGLGAKNIKQRLSFNTSLTAEAATESWMIANKPVPLMFDGTQWVTITGRPSASSIYGEVPIESGGTGASTAEAALTNLGAQTKHMTKTATLSTSGWSNNTQTVSVSGVTGTNTVIVSPAPASHAAYAEANVRCTAQASGKLTFTCDDVPTAELTVNVVILN